MAFWTLHSEGSSVKETITVDDLLGCHGADDGSEMPTLDQLLEADGLLHEMRLQNPLLLSFVTRRPIMQELLRRSFRRRVSGADSNDLLSMDTLVHLMNGADVASDEKKLDTESSICFEIISSESSLVCKALLQDHFEQIMDVLRRPKLEPLTTGRICRLLMNLLNYNEDLLKELLERHDFGSAVIAQIGNFSLMDCLAKSRIVCLMDEKLCADLMHQLVRQWSTNAELARSSAELLVCLSRRITSAAALCLARLVKEEFASDSRVAVKETVVQALIALCDQSLPSPYVGIDMHTIAKQLMVDSSIMGAADISEVCVLIKALNENSDKIESHLQPASDEGQPFGQLRYLLLCLFMRLIVLTTAPDRFTEQKDVDELRHWLKEAVLDYVIPNVLIHWPMNNHAHQAMLGVADMAINAELLDGEEKEGLACKCIEAWYELEQEQSLCPGGWAHWYKLIRKLHPEQASLPVTKNTLAKNAFFWIEQREIENRLRYQQFAPPVDVVLRDQLSSWHEDDEETAWLTQPRDEPVENASTSTQAAQGEDEFHSLWWCSPEDMSTFPDSPIKDEEIEPDCVPASDESQSPT